MSERPRRDTKKSKLDKLAEYKRAREGGGREWKARDALIYDEVDEQTYQEIQRGRDIASDFVEDDGATEYVDNGQEVWDDTAVVSDSDAEDTSRKRKSSKKKGGPKANSKYDDYVKAKPKAPPVAPVSISDYAPVVSADAEKDFLANLLNNVSSAPAPAPVPTRKSRKRKEYVPESDDDDVDAFAYRAAPDFSSDPIDPGSGPSSDDPDMSREWMSPRKKVRIDSTSIPVALEKMGKLEVKSDTDGDGDEYDNSFDDIDMDAFMDVDEDLGGKTKAPLVKKEEGDGKADLLKMPLKPLNGTKKKDEDETPAWLSAYDALSVATEETGGELGFGKGVRTATVTSANISALEDDGSLRFFWLDYLENEGRLYFVGKVRDRTSGSWVSACVTVEGLERNLFVLPRERRVIEVDEEPSDEEEEEMDEDAMEEDLSEDEREVRKQKKERAAAKGKAKAKPCGGQTTVETDQVPSQDDVYTDFDLVRRRAGVKRWRGKFVKRRYAFGEKDVPRDERMWFKVVYGFDEPPIKSDVNSPNFARVFGTTTSPFELLVLKRKIMGPCWLQIKKPHVEHKGVSWCKFEATVSDPKDFCPFAETDSNAPRDMPPLTMMSLSVRTIVNHKENKRELVCATARVWANIQIDDPTPPEQLPCTVHTFVRPLGRFPPNFEARAKSNGRGVISCMPNERALLNNLLISIHKADPDVIIGHEFLGVYLDVLLNRMRELKADHWSRIGRFRRSKWPSIGRQGTSIKFLNGRMLCDLASDVAKGMISSTTWSMTEMCKTHLKIERQDIDPDDTAGYFDGSVSSPNRLLTFVRHCEMDAHFQMAIASKVQILGLAKQLTNLAGNSWNKTLNGGRAERNEYILLHEFHRLKYICPDKAWSKKALKADPSDEDGAEGTKTTKGKRDKYKGGLVFEPKRGLWDKYILVMDFNSLYPSIIQEYNIDFTTVERVEDEDGEEKIPEPPSSEVEQGVLPRLIATLVQRRRQVKALMKDRTATPAKVLQYDIKQQALKLTANSMYGCLGSENSRFHARPLAALTTFKGREILTHTRELAESLQLDVVYGDTDSVFVNSNVTDLAEALKISAEFKKAVNDRYKLLEIDLDSVFQRLLLLQKKKYAAIKVEDGTRTSTEVKGLDMKRREYCALSKSVSQYVLEQILSGEATEAVVERIHEYLTELGENIRGGKVKLDEFIIHKRLGKNPEDYPDAKSQPHVQVALRTKARGGSAKAGDVIPYIFCLAENEEATKGMQADRAKHPDELRKAESELKIDYDYYLAHQILPPIERLCDPIEGTDRPRLAECLGLDPNRYRNSAAGEGEERAFATLDSQMPDSERFKECEPFVVRCRKCEGHVAFAPISDRDSSLLLASGPSCPACQAPLGTASLQVQLECQIRAHIARYYEGWLVCNDTTCGHRTRSMRVYARRCLRTECKGKMEYEFSDAQLYDQIRFFASLFDADKAVKNATGVKRDAIAALVKINAEFLDKMAQVVEKYMGQSGRRWVEFGSLFSFMKI